MPGDRFSLGDRLTRQNEKSREEKGIHSDVAAD